MDRPFRPVLPVHPGAPWILDAYCGAGGASVGYWLAGFNVVGIDIENFKRYPFPLLVADALDELRHLRNEGAVLGHRVVAVHASPPCQAFTEAWKIRQREHPDLIGPTRELLNEIGLPYIIENVEGAPLLSPLVLCGSMFGLGAQCIPGYRELRRHRLFESNLGLAAPGPCRHVHPVVSAHGGGPTRRARGAGRGGYQGLVSERRAALGIDWMTRAEMNLAIPPAYTEHLGRQVLEQLDVAA